jgi:hypothetical protein
MKAEKKTSLSKEPPNVEIETTLLRLCRAVRDLRMVSDVLGYDTPISAASSEIIDAILDLVGVPEDNSMAERVPESEQWCRDSWYSDAKISSKASDEELKKFIVELRYSNQVARDEWRKDFSEKQN